VRELGEHGVPGGMPEAVVDLLEAVQVQVEQVAGAGMPAAGHRLADPLDQQHPVRQSGQWIVQGLVAELGFAPLPFGDVLDVDDQTVGPDPALRYRGDAHRHPDGPAAAKAKTAFVAQNRCSAGQQPCAVPLGIGTVVRVHDSEHVTFE
jgi:hypothetical protein